jgi:hypothetical protein
MLTAFLLLIAQGWPLPIPAPLPPPEQLPAPHAAQTVPYWWPVVRWTLTYWFAGQDLLDLQIDTDIYFRHPKHLQDDLASMARRQRDLAGAPPMFHLERFPDVATCNAAINVNRQHRHYIATVLPVTASRAQQGRLEILCEQLDQSHRAWVALLNARTVHRVWDEYGNTHVHVLERRQFLADLQHAIGLDAWLRGEMPHPLP